MLKYCLAPILLSILLACDWLGPQAVWYFFFGFSAFVIIGDQILTNDHSQFRIGNTKLNFILYLILPLFLLKLFNMTLIGMGDHGSIIFMILADEALFNVWDRAYSVFDLFGIILTSGLFLGGIGTVAGHELVHRKKHTFGFKVSNWLLALTWDPAFGIDRVDSSKGYFYPANVVPACSLCNFVKGDYELNVFMQHLHKVFLRWSHYVSLSS